MRNRICKSSRPVILFDVILFMMLTQMNIDLFIMLIASIFSGIKIHFYFSAFILRNKMRDDILSSYRSNFFIFLIKSIRKYIAKYFTISLPYLSR